MKESREDRFRRIAEARVNKLLHMMKLLGNLSNPSVYCYTHEQLDEIFGALQKGLNEAKFRFRAFGKYGRKRFSLREPYVPAYEKYPYVSVDLPDGSKLIGAAYQGDDYPSITLYWHPAGEEQECQIGFTEFNPDREPGHQVCVAAYQSHQEDTTYYAPYEAEGNHDE